MKTPTCSDFLHLCHSFGPNRDALRQLLAAFDDDAARLRACSPAGLRQAGFEKLLGRIKRDCDDRVARDLSWMQQPARMILDCTASNYPALLREIDDFPLLLYAEGDIDLLRQPQIAIVGSRNCTPGGASNAFEFAAELALAGFTITSGLALGIDGEAHRGALSVGGKTIAVVGTGLDRVYPAKNRQLAEEIAASGLIVSEFAPGSPPRAAHFPQRNRIISGLSIATLVVEAAQRSGSLITARLAAEQGREVFAIPGSIHNPQARGCHRLIREGANIAECAADIVRESAATTGFVAVELARGGTAPDEFELDAAHRELLETIGFDAVTADTLALRSGLTIDKLSSMLQVLELNDLIQSAPGGCYVRI